MGRVDEEFERLKHIYAGLPDNKYSLLLPLMQNAAFMRVTLEELQSDRDQIRAYNATLKNYNMVIKHLEESLPGTETEDKLTMLMDG